MKQITVQCLKLQTIMIIIIRAHLPKYNLQIESK